MMQIFPPILASFSPFLVEDYRSNTVVATLAQVRGGGRGIVLHR